MSATAANLMEYVLPRESGLRQWVLTFPFAWGSARARDGCPRLARLVELALVHDCGLCMPWRGEMPVWMVRGPGRPVAGLWPEMKLYH